VVKNVAFLQAHADELQTLKGTGVLNTYETN